MVNMIGGGIEFLLICVTLVFCVIGYVKWTRKSNFPPGPLGFPIVGHLPLLGQEAHKTAISWIPKYGPIAGINFGSFPAIIISDYKLIKEAGTINSFNGRPKLQYAYDRSGGEIEGIIFTEGRTLREQRTFIHRRLREIGGFGTRSMESAIMDQVEELVQGLRLEVGHPMSTHARFHVAVVNALWAIIAGAPFKQTDPEIQRLTKLVSESFENVNIFAMLVMFAPVLGRIFPDWITRKREIETLYKPMAGFLQPYLDTRYETHTQGETRDLIDAYIDEIKNTSDTNSSFYSSRGKQSMTTSVLDTFIAGIETSSTTLEWVCLLLARFTDVQTRLAVELASVIGQRRPSLDDRKRMPYTESVLHEVMRFRTLLPLGFFHSTIKHVHFHGFDIPKDTMVFFNLYAIHMDPQLWGDPQVFRPERWLSEDETEFIRREWFMPFGVGKRICLGEQLARDELFLFTVGLIQSFRICIDPIGPSPSLEPRLGGTTMTPKPHRLVFNVRENL